MGHGVALDLAEDVLVDEVFLRYVSSGKPVCHGKSIRSARRGWPLRSGIAVGRVILGNGIALRLRSEKNRREQCANREERSFHVARSCSSVVRTTRQAIVAYCAGQD